MNGGIDMKKGLLFFVVMMFFTFAGYVEVDALTYQDYRPQLTLKKLTLEIGEGTALDSNCYVISNSGKWKSSNTKVATVNRWNGYVNAKKVGTTKITLIEGGKTYTCKLKVVPKKKKNAKEVKALKKLIKTINAKGGKLPTNINGNSKGSYTVYRWHNGHLVELNISGYGKANINVSLNDFPYLQKVSMIHGLKSVNIKKCKKLETFEAYFVKEHIDFSKCKKLKSIKLELNKKSKRWKKIDLSKNTNLVKFFLYGDGSAISTINFTKCNKLEYINLSTCNNIKMVDINGCKNLRFFDCSSNNLTSIKYDSCKSIEEFSLNTKKIAKLIFKGFKKLTTLNVYIKGLEIDDCDSLKNVIFSNPFDKSDKPESFKLSNCKYLTGFKGVIEAKQVEVYNCSNLERLWFTGTQNLSIKNCPCLKSLSCVDGTLTNLNRVNCPELYSLSCFNNALTSLDLSGFPNLKLLYCSDNQLTNLDLSKNTALEYLDCSNNKLVNIDLTNNKKLYEAKCDDTCVVTGYNKS